MRLLHVSVLLLVLAALTGCASKKLFPTCHIDEQVQDSCSHPMLSSSQKNEMTAILEKAVRKITDKLDAPEYDGGSYSGHLGLCFSRDGYLDSSMVMRPSGNVELDRAFLEATKSAGQLFEPPKDQCISDGLYFWRLDLTYDESDMAPSTENVEP